jgi:hypothetical protein
VGVACFWDSSIEQHAQADIEREKKEDAIWERSKQ